MFGWIIAMGEVLRLYSKKCSVWFCTGRCGSYYGFPDSPRISIGNSATVELS